MKRTALIGLLLTTVTGCGHGWLPFRPFRGAHCRAGGACTAPAAPCAATCDPCQSTAGFANYDGSVLGGEMIGGSIGQGFSGETIMNGSGYYDGQILHGSAVPGADQFHQRGTTIAPPMSSSIPPSSSMLNNPPSLPN